MRGGERAALRSERDAGLYFWCDGEAARGFSNRAMTERARGVSGHGEPGS